MKFMYKSLVIAMATLMVQSHVFAAKPKTINDQVKKGSGSAVTTSNRVEVNRPEVARIVKAMQNLNLKTISPEAVAKITNLEALRIFEEIVKAPAIVEVAKNGQLSEIDLSRAIDTLTKTGATLGSQSTAEMSDGLEVVQTGLSLSLLSAEKLKEFDMDPKVVDRFRSLLEKEAETAFNPNLLAQAVHSQLRQEGKVSMTFKEWVEAMKNCLKSLKG